MKLPAPVAVERLTATTAPPVVRPASRPQVGEPLVAFERVTFWYDDERVPVVKEVSLTIRKGDVIALLGPNGSGKSTLLKHALGLLRPREGRVLVEGCDTRTATTAQLARTVGYVFQSPTHMLFAPTVREELAFGPRNLGIDAEQSAARAEATCATLGLDGLLDLPPLSLSFGQQKRVGIASVLTMGNRVLVLDEPTAGQDYGSATRFMDEIAALDHFDAVLLVTHNLDLALAYANRVVLLRDGELMADGTPETVLRDPELLRRCYVLPTSLLDLNLALLPQTGRFGGIRALADALRGSSPPASLVPSLATYSLNGKRNNHGDTGTKRRG